VWLNDCHGEFATANVSIAGTAYVVHCSDAGSESVELTNEINADSSSPVTGDNSGAYAGRCDSTHTTAGGYDVCLTAKVAGTSGNGIPVTVDVTDTSVIATSGVTSGGADNSSLAIADGGTGASDAVDARTNLGAAASGANSDITSLSALTGISVSGTVSASHLASTGSVPTVSTASGAGSSAMASIVGTDTAGEITLTTGTAPAASATIVTATFASAYGSAPTVIIVPANANASDLTDSSFAKEHSTTTTFKLTSGTTQLSASKTYKWDYVVVQ
jgi:hypothetical protein